MGFEDDPRVAAAKRWLQSRLEEAFSKTSFDCRSVFAEFQYPPVTTGDGDTVVRQAVREFRERSLECIPKGFSRLLEAIQALQQNAGDELADIAKKLSWEVIDETFSWTAGDRSNSSRFKEWLAQAEANFWVEGGVVMASPKCNMPDASLADQLNCDFRTQFEFLLDRLRDEAFLNSPSAQSMNTAPAAAAVDPGVPAAQSMSTAPAAAAVDPGVPAAQSMNTAPAATAVDPGAPEPYVDDPELGSKDSKVRTIARAKLVRKIRRELDYFRTALDYKKLKEIEPLALRYSKHAIFMRNADGLLLLSGRCRDLLWGKKPAYAELAYEIAAAKGHSGASSMKKAWLKHPELHDLRSGKI